MGNWGTGLTLAVLFGVSVAALAAGSDWPVYRHDAALTSVSPGKGAITKPAVKWEHYLGVPYQAIATDRKPVNAFSGDLDGDGRIETFTIDNKTIKVFDPAGEELWSHTVDGFPLGGNVRVAELLPDRKGLQVISFSSRMDTGEGQGYCFAFDKGAAKGELVWTTGPLTGQYAPTLIVDDVDGDGLPEIVSAPHYRVQIFDGHTGKIKAEVPWDVGRNYGALLTRPRPRASTARPGGSAAEATHKDIFVVCDFVCHVDCIRHQDGEWVHAWGYKYFEPNRPTPRGREIYMRVGPNPVADVDGDGRDEMVHMLVEAEAGDQWRLIARNCETSEVEADVAGVWIWSIADLDNDGTCEIIYTLTRQKRPPTYCDLMMGRISAGKIVKLGSLRRVRPVLMNAALPPNVATIADEGLQDILRADIDRDGLPEFFCAEPSKAGKFEDSLSAASLGLKSKLEIKWRFDRPGHRLNLVHAEPGEALVRDLTSSKVLTLDAAGKVASEADLGRAGGFTTTPVAVDLDGDGTNEIVVQNAAQEIVALKIGKKPDDSPEVLWSLPGVSMDLNPGYDWNGTLSPQAGDVDGDGRKEVVFVSEDKGGLCALTCVDARGKVKWTRSIEGCPWGGLQAGIDNWSFGRFSGREKGLDLYVTLHRRSKGSGEAWAFRGDTGEPMWNRESFVTKETALPFSYLPAIADVNDDGLDELVFAPFTIYAVASGKTGEPIFPPVELRDKSCFGGGAYYFSPTVADLDSDGKLEVYLNSNSYARGVYATLTIRGKPIWYESHDNTEGSGGFGPVGDFDGDGKLEIGIPVLNGALLCLDAADGSRKWKIDASVANDVIAADVNGDGIVELVFAGADGKMHAVSGKDGSEVWSIAATGRPIVADVNGDGLVEVIAVGNDGVLRVIGPGGTGREK